MINIHISLEKPAKTSHSKCHICLSAVNQQKNISKAATKVTIKILTLCSLSHKIAFFLSEPKISGYALHEGRDGALQEFNHH